MQWLVTALGALAALVLGAALLATRRSGHAAHRRRALLGDLGLLQSALLPPVPARVGGLGASVAYRPWDGPGVGGDFYDVFPLVNGRAGAVIGDIGGHGREVIGRTSGLRHTLRAYLEAGLEPRAALELAGQVLEDDRLAPLATVVLAVHDPARETLTWASAGHPPPILLGAGADEPLTAVSTPPLGAGVATGLRQTTVPFPPGSTACLFTDGLSEGGTREGRRLGRARLAELADGLGDRLTAPELLDAPAAKLPRSPTTWRCASCGRPTWATAPSTGAITAGWRSWRFLPARSRLRPCNASCGRAESSRAKRSRP